MKVAIDISPLFSSHRYRGIGVYTENLIKSLQSIKLPNFTLYLIKDKKIPDDCQLIHYPYFDLFWLTLPLRKVRPTVVTIHDVTPLIFPEHYPPGLKGWLRLQTQKFSLRSTKAVITDANASSPEIEKYLNYPKEKIYVVPLAPHHQFRKIGSPSFLRRKKVKYKLPKKFVLYVGDINYNKNIPSLVKACEMIRLPLVIVGKQAAEKVADRNHPENRDLVWLQDYSKISPLERQRVILTGFVPLPDLVAFYNLAAVYCQPSFYEGFGLPVLEAMACCCPVVASNRGSLKEICDKAAEIINPDDVSDIARGLEKGVEDSKRRNELIKRGFIQVKKFSWGKTARRTFEIYQEVLVPS